jgi:hypothetical protein
LTVFYPLKPFSERMGHPDQTAAAIAAKVQRQDGHRGVLMSIQSIFVRGAVSGKPIRARIGANRL